MILFLFLWLIAGVLAAHLLNLDKSKITVASKKLAYYAILAPVLGLRMLSPWIYRLLPLQTIQIANWFRS